MRTSLWKANFIVFMSSTCTLVIELVAGRIMAPYVGVSLYTWTSIIGVVLAGISLGNFAGGRLADRYASPGLLGVLFFLGGLATMGILGATILATSMPLAYSFEPLGTLTIPLVAKIVLFTTMIFFLPCFVLGMVSPVVVKLTLQNLGEAGNVVGMIYAFGAAGSILGTFLTGFLLISSLGTRTIIWIVAVVLIIMGIIFGEYWKVWQKQRASVLGLIILAYGIPFTIYKDEVKAPCIVESNYYCIYVYETKLEDGKPVQALVLDHLIHSYSSLEDPKALGYGYERIYAEVTDYISQTKKGLRALFIGGGGYTYQRHMEAVYPDSAIDVAEIDPAVTQMAYDRLGLSPETRIKTYNQDARLFFNGAARERYDVAFGDAFNDLSIPYHLTTVEFDTLVRDQLSDDGIYMANVIDKFKGGFLGAYMKTLKQVFPYVYLMGPGPVWEFNSASTYVAVASMKPFDVEAFKAFAGRDKTAFTAVLEQDRVEEFLNNPQWITLTDDYAPVDNLVAPLFVERGY